MPNGKPAGQVCVQLTADFQCKIFSQPSRPSVCFDFKPVSDVCGESRKQALEVLTQLEEATK
jgi:hypothetical protein